MFQLYHCPRQPGVTFQVWNCTQDVLITLEPPSTEQPGSSLLLKLDRSVVICSRPLAHLRAFLMHVTEQLGNTDSTGLCCFRKAGPADGATAVRYLASKTNQLQISLDGHQAMEHQIIGPQQEALIQWHLTFLQYVLGWSMSKEVYRRYMQASDWPCLQTFNRCMRPWGQQLAASWAAIVEL